MKRSCLDAMISGRVGWGKGWGGGMDAGLGPAHIGRVWQAPSLTPGRPADLPYRGEGIQLWGNEMGVRSVRQSP